MKRTLLRGVVYIPKKILRKIYRTLKKLYNRIYNTFHTEVEFCYYGRLGNQIFDYLDYQYTKQFRDKVIFSDRILEVTMQYTHELDKLFDFDKAGFKRVPHDKNRPLRVINTQSYLPPIPYEALVGGTMLRYKQHAALVNKMKHTIYFNEEHYHTAKHYYDTNKLQDHIAIHIRLGDYKHAANTFLQVINYVEYIPQSIGYLDSISKCKAPLIIFTDDVADAKQLLVDIPLSHRNIVFPSITDKYPTIILMSFFKQIIISNSSFSLFASALEGVYDIPSKKIKIAPVNWTQDMPSYYNIVDDSYILF